MDQYVHQALLNTKSQPTPLVASYFSDANIQVIQKKLKNVVKKHTNLTIDNQSCEQLYQVMLYVYRMFGKNVTQNVSIEVNYLNDIVINEISPSVISNVLQYINYIKDISKPPQIMPHGKATTVKGDNSLSLPKSYF
jgi:subtilisin-like proprotein convertase family protein